MTTTTQPTIKDTFEMLDPNTVVVESNVRTEDKVYLAKTDTQAAAILRTLTPKADDGTHAGICAALAAATCTALSATRRTVAD